MAASAVLDGAVRARSVVPEPAAPPALGRPVAGLPVPVWGVLASCLAMVIGWNWDISWHRSIGRDTVWTPAHIAIYLALLGAFLVCAGLVLSHTFGRLRRAPGVRVLGFKGPSGAFVTLWGLFLQFAAILFDNWWHNVYGLDIGVFSPPHGILGIGLTVFYFGQFAIAALHRNLVPERGRARASIPVLALGGMLLGHLALTADPYYGPMGMLSVYYVATSAFAFPLAFAFIGAYLGRLTAACASAAIFAGLLVVLMQIFVLFPAAPRFGPVFHRLDFLLPPPFPMPLVVPALAMAFVLRPTLRHHGFARYLAAGAVFVALFNLSNAALAFLLSTPAAANRFFGGSYPGTVFEAAHRVAPMIDLDARSAVAVASGWAIAVGACWIGHRGGWWLREVVR